MIAQYSNVKSYAFNNNLLSYNNSVNQVYDVQGRSENPYQLNNLFAACPNKIVTIQGTESFVCNSNLIWNTTGNTISQVQIDFNNTLGFQNITIGTPITVSYADTGSKRWTIKVTLSDNTVLQCYSDYYVAKAAAGNGAARFSAGTTFTAGWDTHWNVAATANHSGADVYIAYTSHNRTNTLRKPLIVVEGYDVSHVAPNIQDNYTYKDFIDGINEPRNTYDFNQQLDSVGNYDIVFVDFKNGTDDILRNAALLQDVITMVNNAKVTNEQNVVMGLSMGGLVARYTLAKMTKNNINPQTRLLVTHDSPHRGANVPLGLQYLIRMMGNVQIFGTTVYNIYPQYDEAINLFDSPDAKATQQLLIYLSTGTNTYVNNTFLDGDYRNMITFSPTDPQPAYRFIATSQGSECAHPLFAPGKTFINVGAGIGAGIYARFLFFRIPIVTYALGADVEAYALPNVGTTAKIARLYTINQLQLFGFINVFKQLYNNTAFSSGTQLPVDGVPGSVRPFFDVKALQALADFPKFNPINISIGFSLGPVLAGYVDIYAHNGGFSPEFTFEPVASALDASPFNTNIFSEKYVNGVNQFYPSSSATFIAQETNASAGTTNNVHLRFTARNSRWLFNEMENLNNTENCSGECSNPYYMVGADLICSSETYFIPGLQRGATVTWTIFPAGIVTSSTSGQQITLTKYSTGNITLTATVSNGCSSNPLNKSIHVGGYGSGDYPVSGPSSTSCNSYVTYTTNQLAGATNYAWFYPGNWTYVSGQGTYMLTLLTNSSSMSNYYQIGVRVANACDAGGSPGIMNTYFQGCGFYFAVSPNPATSAVTVSSAQTTTKQPLQKTITGVNIYGQDGNLRKHQLFNKVKSATVNVSDLSTGIYFIEIVDGQYKERHQLSVVK